MNCSWRKQKGLRGNRQHATSPTSAKASANNCPSVLLSKALLPSHKPHCSRHIKHPARALVLCPALICASDSEVVARTVPEGQGTRKASTARPGDAKTVHDLWYAAYQQVRSFLSSLWTATEEMNFHAEMRKQGDLEDLNILRLEPN